MMSFNFFSNINPIKKAQAIYKDGGGMGGGGMYMQQNNKKKENENEDIFEFNKENDSLKEDINFNDNVLEQAKIENYFNKFVNWFRLKK